MPRKSKAQCARYQNVKFARKSCVIVQKLEEPNDVSNIEMTEEHEEPVCGSEDPEMRNDEFENYGEGILGGVECWDWSKDGADFASESEYDPEDSPESETESEVGLEDVDEEKNLQKEAELLAFSEALHQAQVNAVALEKASRTTKRHRGKSTGKSLSTIHRIARANAALARSGQKSILSFFIGKKRRVADNSDEDLEMMNLIPEVPAEAELDNDITETTYVSSFSFLEHGCKAYCTAGTMARFGGDGPHPTLSSA